MGPAGRTGATAIASRTPAVAWTMADHATGADPCDSHCCVCAEPGRALCVPVPRLDSRARVGARPCRAPRWYAYTARMAGRGGSARAVLCPREGRAGCERAGPCRPATVTAVDRVVISKACALALAAPILSALLAGRARGSRPDAYEAGTTRTGVWPARMTRSVTLPRKNRLKPL